MHSNSQTFLTTQQLAERWHVSEKSVRRMILAGRFKVQRFGRSVRISSKVIEEFEVGNSQ